MSAVTDDTLLGGRVALRQPARGFRAAVDPVLLAAFVPARSGDRVLEAGCGSGAAFLCLAARVPGLAVVAVERDETLAALAGGNAVRNGLAAARVVQADIADTALARATGPHDHGFANPPYWPGGTPPPEPARAAATHEADADLGAWARFLAAGLRRGGTVSLILPAARFDAGVAALRGAGCGGIVLLPLLPRAGRAARRVLLRGTLGARSPAAILPALILHADPAGYTPEAERVLRDGAPLGDAGP